MNECMCQIIIYYSILKLFLKTRLKNISHNNVIDYIELYITD